MTCQVCGTKGHRGTTSGNGPDPTESCACGHLVSRADAREMGEEWVKKLIADYELDRVLDHDYTAADAADDAADVAYDIAQEDR